MKGMVNPATAHLVCVFVLPVYANVYVPNRDQILTKLCASFVQTLTSTPQLQYLDGTWAGGWEKRQQALRDCKGRRKCNRLHFC